DPKTVPTISNAVERKMTTGKVEDIEIRGTSLENFSDLKFKLAMKKDMPIPRFILNFIGNRFTKKPVPDKNKCIGCGICATACPKHCIQIADKLAKINYKECIRCYCCHELCPERAIELK
ncbi:MAG: 4Fe-4S binding protein, partial [Thermoplasmata archaeon]|nr:4Fe-4S binding protein [Thermoplasmata archaeon]